MIKYLCSWKVSLPGMEAIDKGSWYKLGRGAINCTISLCLNWPLTLQFLFSNDAGHTHISLSFHCFEWPQQNIRKPQNPNLFSNYCRRFPSIYNNTENYCHLEKLSNILDEQHLPFETILFSSDNLRHISKIVLARTFRLA